MKVSNIEILNIIDIINLPLEKKLLFLQWLNEGGDAAYTALKYDWPFWARPNQLQPPELGVEEVFIWFLMAGRGYGKTRTLAQWVDDKVKNGDYRNISLVGAAADEVRTIMIEGESGLLACSSPDFYPTYNPSKKQITWPNGALANIYYGTEPEKSRGAQSDLIWADEIAKWQYPQETFDNLLMGLRLGSNPLCGVSSTPKPTKFIKELTNRTNPETGKRNTIVTRGNTFDNLQNLAKPFINTIITKYKGTRLGRQELNAEILDDNPNALWKRDWLDRDRISKKVDCHRLVVSIDPPGTEPDKEKPEKEVTEAGIIVVGEGKALPGMMPPPGVEWEPGIMHYYVFADLSLEGSPEKWAKEAVSGYNKFGCGEIVAETNFGGAMVKSTIKNVDSNIKVYELHASRGKYIRAEPVSLLYEQGRVHHIGNFSFLEDELCEWVPGMKSPNRLDALVWGIIFLSDKSIYSEAPSVRKHDREKFKSVVRNLPT
jgi:phage terminase large subunit-like protein